MNTWLNQLYLIFWVKGVIIFKSSCTNSEIIRVEWTLNKWCWFLASSKILLSSQRGADQRAGQQASPMSGQWHWEESPPCVCVTVWMVTFRGVSVQTLTWTSWLSLSSWAPWWRLVPRCPLLDRHVYATWCWAEWCTGPSPQVRAAWGNPDKWSTQQWGALC